MSINVGYHSICWGGVVGEPVGVTSIKDLFYLSNGDLERALSDIAASGYQGFEVFDGNLAAYSDDLPRIRDVIRDTGLTPIGVYSGANFIFDEILGEELWRIEKSAALAAEIGAPHLVIGGGAQRSTGIEDSDYPKLGRALDRVVSIARSHGLDCVFHPHLTTIVESPDQIARVLSESEIGLCVDTAHVAAGGGDPAEVIRAHSDRLGYVHLKDLIRDPFSFQPLGRGELDLAGVVEALKDVDYDGWLTVELDSYDGDPREAAEASRRFLADLGI